MLCLLAMLLMAAEPTADASRLAVLEFSGTGADVELLRLLADQARQGALEGLEGARVQVMTRESIEAVLHDMGKCAGDVGDCEVETGRTIGAKYIVTGELFSVTGHTRVVLKLFETGKGTLLASETVSAESSDALVDAVRRSATGLVQRALVPGTGSSFGQARPMAAPVVTVGPRAGVSGLNMRAEQLLENAEAAQEAHEPDLQAVRSAWCELAGVTDNNPYLQQARQGCDQWTAYLAAREKREREFAEDFTRLSAFLELKRRPFTEKAAAAKSFVTAYEDHANDPRVAAAKAAQAALEREEPVHLPMDPEQLKSFAAWSKTIENLSAAPGKRVTLGCPPRRNVQISNPSDELAPHASLCAAAVHQGIISEQTGGIIHATSVAGEDGMLFHLEKAAPNAAPAAAPAPEPVADNGQKLRWWQYGPMLVCCLVNPAGLAVSLVALVAADAGLYVAERDTFGEVLLGSFFVAVGLVIFAMVVAAACGFAQALAYAL